MLRGNNKISNKTLSNGADIRNNNNNRLVLLIFSFFFVINVASGGGHFDWWDGTEAFLVTESMVLKHSAMLYPDVPSVQKLHFDIRYTVYSNTVLHTGKYYDQKTMQLQPVYTVRSLLLSALAVPFYLLASIFSFPPIPVIALFFNSIIISLSSVVIFLFSLEVYSSQKVAFVLSLVFGVCSFVWPYHTSFWSMPLQALFLITAAYLIYRSLHYHFSFICNYTRLSNSTENNKGIYFAGLGGLFLGLSVFAHPTSVILVPGFIAYCVFSPMRKNMKTFVSFLVGLGTTLFFIGVINYLRFGSFMEFGYAYFESLAVHDGWHGLVGLLASPGAGLIFFFPVSVLLPLAFIYMYRQNKGLFFLSAYIMVATWLDVGTLSFGFEPFAWSGAIAWGPRYLIPVLPFITLVLGSLLIQLRKLPSKRRLFLKIPIVILCVAGFYVNLVGTLTWYQYGIMYGWDKDNLAKDPNYMEAITWNPVYSPIILHSKAMISNFVAQIHPEKYINTVWYWTAFGLAPCSYDDYIFCKFGIIAIGALIVIIAILAAIIMIEIGSRLPTISKSTIVKTTFGS
jgi:hypothetical protein